MRIRRRSFEPPEAEFFLISSLSLVPLATIGLIVASLAMGIETLPQPAPAAATATTKSAAPSLAQEPAVTVDLPDSSPAGGGEPLSPPANRLAISRGGQVSWNSQPVSDDELAAILLQARADPVQPALLFEPDGDAAYARAVEILELVRTSGLLDGCFFFSNAGQYRRYERREADSGPQPAQRRHCVPPTE